MELWPTNICVLHINLMYILSLLIDLLFQGSMAMLLLKLWKQQLHWLAIPRGGPILASDTPKFCSQQCYPGSVSFFIVFKYNLLVICQHICLPCQSAYSSRAEAASDLCIAKYLVLGTMPGTPKVLDRHGENEWISACIPDLFYRLLEYKLQWRQGPLYLIWDPQTLKWPTGGLP